MKKKTDAQPKSKQNLTQKPFSITKKRKLFIEHSSGCAGDMLCSALLDLSDNPTKLKKQLLKELEKLNLGEKISLRMEVILKKGIRALYSQFKTPEDDWFVAKQKKTTVKNAAKNSANLKKTTKTPIHHHQHHSHDAHEHHHNGDSHHSSQNDLNHHHSHHHAPHRSYEDIKKIILKSSLQTTVKESSIAAFDILATAEAAVHNTSKEKIHFHEVGSLDAILEVVSFCQLLQMLGIEEVVSSPLVVGSGHVNCQHGLMPVPVPAVVKMLEYSKAPFRQLEGNLGELTTPTGAALTLSQAKSFGTLSSFQKGGSWQLSKSAAGAGKKNFSELANLVRVFLFEDHSLSDTNTYTSYEDEIVEITTSIDDATPEEIARLSSGLMDQGALDVAITQQLMKKGRPGYQLSLLCKEDLASNLGNFLLDHSPTLGYRFQKLKRKILSRENFELQLEGVNAKVKVVTRPSGSLSAKIEDSSLKKALAKPVKNLQTWQAEVMRKTLEMAATKKKSSKQKK